MPSRRDMIRMTPDEVAAYLKARSRIILVTNGPHGLPHPMPMNYGVDDEGRIIVTSFAKSQKVVNVQRDPRAALMVESGGAYGELAAVVIWADVEIIAEPEEVAAMMRRIAAREALADSIDAAQEEQIRASVAKRVVLRFTPFRTVSWDHGKLAGKY